MYSRTMKGYKTGNYAMIDYEKIISPVVSALPPSGIRKFFDIVAEMDDAISLGVG